MAASLIAGALALPLPLHAQTPPAAAPASPPGPPPPPGGKDNGMEQLKTGLDLSSRMTTPVKVNGQGPFNFIVDTGSNRSGVSAEVAAALKLPPGNPVRVHGIATPFLAQTVNIAQLNTGSLRMKLDDAPVFARADLGADGIIGLDVIHDHVVLFDFGKQRIELSRTTRQMGTWTTTWGQGFGGAIVQARQRFGQLTIIDAVANRASMTCFIDTGADRSVGNIALKKAIQARQKPEDIIDINVMIRGATGQVVEGVVAEAPNMRIGGVFFTRFPLAFADLHTFELWDLANKPALLFGMDLLGLFETVEIDFNQSQVTFRTH